MMLKNVEYNSTTLNRFDLLGNDEVGLAKAFAYLISSEPSILYSFLRDIGIRIRNTSSNYLTTSIEIEKVRDEGRTDIEIKAEGKFHVIIECKVGRNRITRQRKQYIKSFEDVPQKVLCFITQERDFNRETDSGIEIHYRGWLDIIDLVSNNNDKENTLASEFVTYTTRGFKMRDQKEVLIQDLSTEYEIERFEKYNVYRRGVTYGSPLYFAPYFTRNAGGDYGEGILRLSRILGVLTIRSNDLINFEDDLKIFADGDKNLLSKWKKGVGIKPDKKNVYTFYFLGDPVELPFPLLKDGGREKGRGKGWIAAMIPPNRCVTFEEFVRRMVMATEK